MWYGKQSAFQVEHEKRGQTLIKFRDQEERKTSKRLQSQQHFTTSKFAAHNRNETRWKHAFYHLVLRSIWPCFKSIFKGYGGRRVH